MRGPDPEAKLRPTNAFRVKQGMLYACVGLVSMVSPDFFAKLILMRPFVAAEVPLVRSLGVAFVLIGYFYAQGARTNSKWFPKATVTDRIFIVQPLMAYLYAMGVRPKMCGVIAVLDFFLGLLTQRSINKENEKDD